MQVFVVMGNDYPDAVFNTEKAANDYCARRKAENKPNERVIYWRAYEFTVVED